MYLCVLSGFSNHCEHELGILGKVWVLSEHYCAEQCSLAVFLAIHGNSFWVASQVGLVLSLTEPSLYKSRFLLSASSFCVFQSH